MCRFKSVVALDHPNLDRGGDLHPRVAPAVMTLLGDRAWTLPAWLDRALPSISLESATPAKDAEDVAEDELAMSKPA